MGSLAALNQLIAAAFAEEQPAMGLLPAEPFDPARLLQARVDGRARVCVRQNYYYSVPARYAGRRLPVRLSATAGPGPRRRARPGRPARSLPPTSGTGTPPAANPGSS